MKRWFFIYFLFCLCFGMQSAVAKIPDKLAAIEKKYKKAGSFVAHFEQVVEVSLTKRKKNSSGVLWLKFPDRFRWETYDPNPGIVVSDGKTLWNYTPPWEPGREGQVVSTPAVKSQSEFAQVLLSGSFSRFKNVKIQTVASNEFDLIPEKGAAGDLRTARISIDPKKETIDKVSIDYYSGNRAVIEVKNLEFGKKLNDSMFKFEKPPGTVEVSAPVR